MRAYELEGHYRPVGETPFKWRFAVGPIVALGCVLARGKNNYRQSCGRFHNLQIYIGAASMIMIINLDVLQKSFI